MKRVWFVIALLWLLNTGCQRPQPLGNEVRILLQQDPESLNPVSYSSKSAGQLINLLFQSLLTVDLADGKLKPLLAESLPSIQNNDSVSLLVYHVRQEATWADGKPVTAADVAFSLKVLKAPLVNNEKRRPDYDFIRDIRLDAADPKKITLVCDPLAPGQQLLSGDFFVMPQSLFDPDNLLTGFTIPQFNRQSSELESNARLQMFAERFNAVDFTRNPEFLKGSAGYELAFWKTGQVVEFKQKSNWWGKKLNLSSPQLTANPEKIVFTIIPDNAAALLAFRSKQLDVWPAVPSLVFKQLQAQSDFSGAYQFFTPQTYSLVYFGMNARNPKLADTLTRQALAHLFDLKNIIKLTQGGLATTTIGPVSPQDKLHYNSHIRPYGFDPARAQALLKQAGWRKNGNIWDKKIAGEILPLNLQLTYAAGNSEFENIALIIQQAAASIGIPVTLQALESGLLTQKLKQGEIEIFIRSMTGNPFTFNFRPVFHTESIGPDGLNYTGFGNVKTDALIDELYHVQGEKRKIELIHRLQDWLHRESNLVFLYFLRDRLVVDKRFANLKISGLKPGYDVSAFKLQAE